MDNQQQLAFAGKIFLRGTIKSETVTYTVVIPVLAFFAFFNYSFAIHNPVTFLFYVTTASIAGLLAGLFMRFMLFRLINKSIRQFKSGKADEKDLEKAIVRAHHIPYFEALIVFIRWIGVGAPIIFTPFLLSHNMTMSELLLVVIMMGLTGLVSMPAYFLIFEEEMSHFLRLPALKAVKIPVDKLFKLTIAQKLIVCIVLTVSYPTGILLILIGYSNTGYLDLRNNTIGFILLVLASLFISTFISMLLAKNMKNSLNEMKFQFEAISRGDLTVTGSVPSYDEIGAMVSQFNYFIQQLKQNFLLVQQAADKLSGWVVDITGNSQGLADKSRISAGSSSEIMLSMQNFAVSLTGFEKDILTQNQIIHQSVSAVEELAAGVTSIVETASRFQIKAEENHQSIENSRTIISRFIEENQKLNQYISDISVKIAAIGQKTETINEVVQLLDDVVEQTRLLSMNAAIEAAHAGESGKGFAIVANEVRSLSDNSAHSINNIHEIIMQIKVGIEEAVKISNIGTQLSQKGKTVSEEASRSLESIVVNTKAMNQMVKEISIITSEQGKATSDVMQSMAQLDGLTKKTSDIVKVQSETSDKILLSIQSVSELSKDNSHSAENLSGLIGDLQKENESLSGMVQQFKLK